MITLSLIVASAIFTLPHAVDSAESNGCPDVRPIEGLDLAEWIRASWYIAEQQINGYQSEEDLYCVVASYLNQTEEKKKVPLFSGTVISVHNYENKNRTNGPVDSTDKNIPSGLCARAKNESRPSELLVAPCFLPNFAAGPYWMIALGEDAETGKYTWAVVSGGKPTEKFPDGCTTKETGVNGSGLWIFTRSQIARPGDVEAAKKALQQLGYTTSRLKTVAQEACKYAGAVIKH